MTVYVHIVINGTDILISNIDNENIQSVHDFPFEYIKDKVDNLSCCKEKRKIDSTSWIYLCIIDNNITRKIFQRHLDFLISIFPELLANKLDSTEKNAEAIRRLAHNISGYTAKIQDQLESIIPHNINNSYNWRTALNNLKESLQSNNISASRSIFHIYKNVQLIKAEMDVYDIMNSDLGTLNITEHQIRKVVDLTLQSFFLDFLDKNVNIQQGTSKEYVLIDFPTFSVVLGHILNNAVKYIAENSTLDINFEKNKTNALLIRFRMTSILVSSDEHNKIFNESYSGKWVIQAGLQGHGFGMYYAKQLIEKNHGTLNFIPGVIKYKLNGIPYADNIIEICLPLANFNQAI